MLKKEATSQKAMERARANYQIALEKRKESVAGLTQSKASLAQSEAALAKARANLGAPGDDNASIREAQATLREAELDFEFTRVKAPVDGYVTNLNLRIGSQAVTNQPALALVDINSYWVHGFFKENSIEDIRKGNKAIITLMTYPDTPLEGHVDSLGWGIAQQDGSTGEDLLPNVSATFEWIRLAQRVPVRIHLVDVPDNVALRVGTTASVLVMTGEGSGRNRTGGAAGVAVTTELKNSSCRSGLHPRMRRLICSRLQSAPTGLSLTLPEDKESPHV